MVLLDAPFVLGRRNKITSIRTSLFNMLQEWLKVHLTEVGNKRQTNLPLAKYLETDQASEANQTELPVIPQLVALCLKKDDVFVWSWMGIVVNIGKDGNSLCDFIHWLNRFSDYKPVEVRTFWSENHLIAEAVVELNSYWHGFSNATEFE